jgi:hypothetical protein
VSSEVTIDSVPRGATIVALPENKPIGKTPYSVTLPGSTSPRHYKLVLAGYDDMAFDVTPAKATVELKPELVRAVGGAAPSGQDSRPSRPTPTGATQPDTSTAVTRPDTSTAVTKPDTSTAVTKPDTSATPEVKPEPTPDNGTVPAPAEPPKPAPDPANGTP